MWRSWFISVLAVVSTCLAGQATAATVTLDFEGIPLAQRAPFPEDYYPGVTISSPIVGHPAIGQPSTSTRYDYGLGSNYLYAGGGHGGSAASYDIRFDTPISSLSGQYGAYLRRVEFEAYSDAEMTHRVDRATALIPKQRGTAYYLGGGGFTLEAESTRTVRIYGVKDWSFSPGFVALDNLAYETLAPTEPRTSGVLLGSNDHVGPLLTVDGQGDANALEASLGAFGGVAGTTVLRFDHDTEGTHSRSSVFEAIAGYESDLNPGDLFVFFYSGHGGGNQPGSADVNEWISMNQSGTETTISDDTLAA